MELCRHGDIEAACLDCLADPPPPPPPGECWCGNRTTVGRTCGACKARYEARDRTPSFREGKRKQDWVATRDPLLQKDGGRSAFVATRRRPAGLRDVCPGCGLEISPGQLVVRFEEGLWHKICR